MRELKFRAWDDNDKRYRYSFNMNDRCKVIECVDGEKVYMTYAVEQYTGLKDKNGKEIYEGDIIHRGALSKANVFRNSVICFDEESVGFIATSTRNGVRTLFNGHTCDEVEIIGNIHENPELLGDE